MLIVSFGVYSIKNIEIAENINTSLPGSKDFRDIKPFIDHGKKAVVLSLSIPDEAIDPYKLSLTADLFLDLLNSKSADLLDSVIYKSDVEAEELLHFFLDHIYLYLDESDYSTLDSLLQKKVIAETVKSNKSQLYSPEGLFLKEILMKDPLHFVNLLKDKLFSNSNSERLGLSDGLFISSDRSKLYFFSTLNYDPSESSLNAELSNKMAQVQSIWNKDHPENEMDYFGTFLIADANASQIKKDIMITVSIAMLLILSLLLYYYRNPLLILLFVLPGGFGILFSISLLYLIQGEVSAI